MGYVCEKCGLYFIYPLKFKWIKPEEDKEEEKPLCPRCLSPQIRKVD